MTIKEKMVAILADYFDKSEDSNISKLIGIVAEQIEKLNEAFKEIQDSRDIDLAFGQTLDNIGTNLGEPRNGMDDPTYRDFLKTSITAALSRGDMETVLSMGRVLYGQDVLGIIETWALERYEHEPAGLVMKIENTRNDGIDLDYQLLKRVMAAGVRLYIEVYQPRSVIAIHSSEVLNVTRSVMLGQYMAGNMNTTGVING